MRRFAMVGAMLTMGTMLEVLTPVAGSTAAFATGPQHVKSTFTFEGTFSVFCDFDLHNVEAGSGDAVIFPARMIHHITVHIAHTNLATGFTLTETDHFTEFTAADGQIKDVGLFWHLRNPDGKLVVVQAGQLVVSATGEVLKFTPGVNPDAAAVICPGPGGTARGLVPAWIRTDRSERGEGRVLQAQKASLTGKTRSRLS